MLLPLPQRQVHFGHKELGKIRAAAFTARVHRHIVAGGELHAEEVDAEVGEDKHEDDEHDGHQEDLLEAAAELGHDLAHVRHQDEDPGHGRSGPQFKIITRIP